MTYTNHRTTTRPTKPLLARLGIAGLLFSFALAILSGTASAANVTMSLISSAGTVQQNGVFTVTVRVAAGSSKILDAGGRVNYNASQLSLTSATYLSGSEWDGGGQGTGYYQFYRIYPGGQAGTINVVRLTFKAKASSGTSTISISNAEVGDGDSPPPANHTVSAQGASITLTAPPAPKQKASPGTTVQTTDSQGNTTNITGPKTNPKKNQAQTVTDESELAAATSTSEEAAKTIDAEIAGQSTSSGSSTQKRVWQTAIIGALAAAAVAVAILLIRKKLTARNQIAFPNAAPSADGMITGSQMNAAPPAEPKTPEDPTTSGTVIRPGGDTKDKV